MASSQTTIIPHSQEAYVTRPYPSESDLDLLIQNVVVAQKAWAAVPLEQRLGIGRKFTVCYQINTLSIA
jgi:acyl-CoA reductase-like NAD-dependent aldehyde dehydrogenase